VPSPHPQYTAEQDQVSLSRCCSVGSLGPHRRPGESTPRGGDDRYMQACFTAFEECPTPVVAAVDGAAYGAAVDLLTCCDLRYCTTSARFCIKEVCLSKSQPPAMLFVQSVSASP
jgi:hypothetical protein